MTKPEPLVCMMDAIAPAERLAHVALIRRLFRETVEETRILPDGFAFRFPAAAFDHVAQFLSRERRCCPFLTFEIRVGARGGPVWLHLTGPDGTRNFLAAELPGLESR